MENIQQRFSPVQRIITIALFSVIAFSFLFQNVAKQMFTPANLFSDYQSYHFAAETLRDGDDPYDIQNLIIRAEKVDTAIAVDVPPYRHSLLELIPVIPLTQLEYADAKRIWILFIGATVFLCIWLLMRYFLPWKITDPPSLIVGSLLLLFAPLVYSMQIHQINTLLLALLLGGIVLLRKNKWVLAALLFAIAIQSKFFVGAIVLALFFIKQYKIVALTILFSVILFAAPFFIFSGTWDGYNTHVVDQISGGELVDNPLNPIKGAGTTAHFKNVSLAGAATRLLTDQELVTPLVELNSIDWIRYFGIAVFFAGLIYLFVHAKKLKGSDEDKILIMTSLILFIWFIFASPISWQHHLVLILLVIPWLLKRADWVVQKKGISLMLIFGLLGSMVIASPPGGSPHIIRHLFALAPFIGLILLMVVFWMLYYKVEIKENT